ncbi:chromate transporter [Salibacterium salarium]|uniref:Chromate transporter n=1 Tax=Salibacterium salarium TaxID=284579 RepID=A0A428MXA8_9BACI|nr:chromate transporter [Salibacterium salarium]RSL30781.1 chromate transporter [Salibacterium salarium]
MKNNGSLIELFLISLRLGLTSFGGPVAHLGYFHEEYVRRRKWMDEKNYADLVALAQFLPGPASSQVGMGIGMVRAGVPGALVSFLGFTLPSVVALIVFAALLQNYDLADAGWINGLKVVAVAVVAHAVLGMGKKLTPDRERASIAVVTMILLLLWQTVYSQVLLIIAAGVVGLFLYNNNKDSTIQSMEVPIRAKTGAICLGVFISLLAVLPLARSVFSIEALNIFDSFYRAGALVFGGGHVVLPLLEQEVVSLGWVNAEEFLAGYGAAQAVPGPLFTFATYLGAVMGGWSTALLATAAIFLPAFLLIIGSVPFWDKLRQQAKINAALYGINAAVVGILAAAFYDPIFTSAIENQIDFALAVGLFGLLYFWKMPAWQVVLIGIAGGIMIGG